MASLILLKVEGAPGDVTIGDFKEVIAVESFSWNLEAKVQEQTPNNGKAPTGRVHKLDAKSLNIKKRFDSASTKLHKMMQTDNEFSATLTFIDPAARGARAANGKINIDYVLKIELQGCHIDRISLSASDSGKSISLSENLVISFTGQAAVSYNPFDQVTKVRSNASTADIPPSELTKS